MRLQNPFAALSTTGLDSQVLTVLAGTETLLSVTQIRNLLPETGSRQGVQNSVGRLVDQGIISEVTVGRSQGYTLNRRHLLADAIRQIADTKRTLITRMISTIADWDAQPITVKLFGSAARDTMDNSSDIDVLLVFPDSVSDVSVESQVQDLASRVASWTGNDVEALTYRESEIGPDPLFSKILTEGIDIAGDPSWLRRQVSSTRLP